MIFAHQVKNILHGGRIVHQAIDPEFSNIIPRIHGIVDRNKIGPNQKAVFNAADR